MIKLLATNLIQGKTQSESIVLLGQMGLDRNMIAEVVGASPATVSVRLSEAKSNKKGTKKTT